ncbi:MAG: hypothetical protein DPW18_14115 [Chloroflexi bacterium]|nr:hypothetical protein [Chloroflexota bacterium]MDL1944242.1 hypothetical protein [Chloroflexi bacterium CFX2]
MNLIDRYVAEVGRRLLLVKSRKDIENELRSTLEDMLEERAQKSGKPADEAMQMELLKEYGAPAKVAETYNPNPYLIGPRIFPFFMFILKIVVAAVALGLGIATFIQIINLSPMSAVQLLETISKGILNIISTSIAVFGNMALIFALIERFAPIADFKMDEDKEWDPASLQKEPEPQDIKIWEPILAIVFTFIALSLFNFNPHLIGIYHLDEGEWKVIPLLSEAFFRWLPLLNIAWVVEIILNGMLLRSGKWTTSTRLISIGTKLFQVVILALLFTGPSILAVTPASLAVGGITDPEAAQTLSQLAHTGMKIALGLAIFGTVVDMIKSVYKMFTAKAAA